jgi:hypothetical protein
MRIPSKLSEGKGLNNMKKKHLFLGLALLPLCLGGCSSNLGGCSSNNSNTQLVVYCSHYYFAHNPNSGTEHTRRYNYIDCESCVGLATEEEKANNDNYEESSSIYNSDLRVESHIEAKAHEGWKVIDYALLELPCSNSNHPNGDKSFYDYHYRHRHYLVTYAR